MKVRTGGGVLWSQKLVGAVMVLYLNLYLCFKWNNVSNIVKLFKLTFKLCLNTVADPLMSHPTLNVK